MIYFYTIRVREDMSYMTVNRHKDLLAYTSQLLNEKNYITKKIIFKELRNNLV